MTPALLDLADSQGGSGFSSNGRNRGIVRCALHSTNSLSDGLRLHRGLIYGLCSPNYAIIPDVVPHGSRLLIWAIAMGLMGLPALPVDPTLFLLGQHLNGVRLLLFIIVLRNGRGSAEEHEHNDEVSHVFGLYVYYTHELIGMFHKWREGLSALSLIRSIRA